MARDIALTVLGGFLGAGKTTLLNHLLRRGSGERVLVMVNDFGAVNVDAGLIARGAGASASSGILQLTNGCACCAVGGDLMQAFLKVLALPEPPDRVVVEASGVGDPGRIAQIGRAGGGFRGDGVITVVDAEAVRRLADDRYVGDTVRAQLRAADLLLLNKTDLADAAALAGLRRWLAAEVPDARLLACHQGRVDPRLVFGIGVEGDAGATGLDMEAEADAPHAARFAASRFDSHVPFSRPALAQALDTLPPQVLRAKGMVWLEGEAAPRLLQLCGKRWSLGRPEPGAAAGRSTLVLIAVREGRGDGQAERQGERKGDVFDPFSHFAGALADTGARVPG
ncbi:hypothetical protein BKK79_21940 [Cupriavidus sp. USMAA2-4]|uniref:CobW family GTP-binding protein n=1 Tax=Cupriavidus sp. USMAA2-4 TaxID=876364 RepID=UPI0008A68794|nr:CobW family GTP-binding protein [Cupriavidus sp. USMAA2-4]AOY94594.1 hypothetical protein BKK79_21940 [Cupriavidus sp. USMAA2-4]